MNNFNELTIEELSSVDAGHGSWDTMGETVSGLGGGAIGSAAAGAMWGEAAGPAGALAGAFAGAAIYWLME